MKNIGENTKKKSVKIIKFKQRSFKSLPEDAHLYSLNESTNRRFDKKRLLRESTLDYNGFSADVIDLFPKHAEEILTIARNGVYDDKKTTLNEISYVLVGNEVSTVNGSKHWQEDWQNAVCAYVDVGDPNAKTIIYDTITEEFQVMSINDFTLLKDHEYGII